MFFLFSICPVSFISGYSPHTIFRPVFHSFCSAPQIVSFRGHFGTVEVDGVLLGPFTVTPHCVDEEGAAELELLSLDSTTLKVRVAD